MKDFILTLCLVAMQKKPEGESRIPTDIWSGMGFSKSMPESAIRERLARNQGLRYCEPTMETTYEVCRYLLCIQALKGPGIYSF